jgi:NitT/TauT family transport system substrate-binding protein
MKEMEKRKRLIIILVGLLVVAAIALLGGVLGKKKPKVLTGKEEETAVRCAWDGTKLKPIYQVDAFLDDGSTATFCSIYCAIRWLEKNKDKVIYFTVVDEVTGQKFDSTLGYYVESDVITVPEVKNRAHAFASKEDALKHARQFNGKLIENPFGEAFVVPEKAQFDRLTIGAPLLPDALPARMAVFKPIFKENKLDVILVPFDGEMEAEKLLADGSIDAAISDLPAAILLSKTGPNAQIIRNMLRPNPYEPIFAIVAGPKGAIRGLSEIAGRSIAVPTGVSFRFYAEFYLKRAGIPLNKVVMREVEDVQEAWDLLIQGEVSASLLRTPFTEIAAAENMNFLADDRILTWTSVLLVGQSAIEKKPKAVEKLVFALGQSSFALNLKPDEYRVILEQKGGIPERRHKDYPMPTFEVANTPTQDEIKPIVEWLVEKGFLSQEVLYEDLVNTQFIPNPNDVGLAFCCS